MIEVDGIREGQERTIDKFVFVWRINRQWVLFKWVKVEQVARVIGIYCDDIKWDNKKYLI